MIDPCITIIIPVFNRGYCLATTIKAVISQTYQNWELIVVDDGSTDSTKEVISGFQKKSDAVKLLTRSRYPKGACTCRNIGIENARGDYVVFLDSDDVLLPNALQQRVDLFRTNSNFDFIVTPGATTRGSDLRPQLLWNTPSNVPNLERFLNFDGPWQTTGPTWRRESLRKNRLRWDEKLTIWQDIDFHIQALEKGMKYQVFWNKQFDYVVNNSTTDSISRVGYHSPAKSESKKHFWDKLVGSTDAGNIEKDWLKPLAISVSRHFVLNHKWKDAAAIINNASKKGVVTKDEMQKLKFNMLLNRFSFGRIAFPNKRIITQMNRSLVTLQQVSVPEMKDGNGA